MPLNPTGFLNTTQQHLPSFLALNRIIEGLFGGAGETGIHNNEFH
jgi:hypothetical protein